MELSPILAVAMVVLALVASWFLAPMPWARLLKALARRWAGMRSRKRSVEGVLWHCLEGGEGPVVVLLHGFAAEAHHWLALARALRGRFRLLIPDLPGFGDSEPATELRFDVPEQARRLGSLLDQLGIGHCILGGNSMGGWIAADLAAHRPDRVRALWLMDPLGVTTARASELLEDLERAGRNPFAVANASDFRRLVRAMCYRRLHLPYPLVQAGTRAALRLGPDLERMRREILERSAPFEALAPRLTMPVLIQWGQADRAVDVSGAAVLGQLLPRAEVMVQKQVGHLPMLEAPFRSARLFMEFYDRAVGEDPQQD